MSGDLTSGDITAAGDITSMGQNVRRDKMSRRTKQLAGQNVRNQTSGGTNVQRPTKKKRPEAKHPFSIISIDTN
jgi:hypothetical protein